MSLGTPESAILSAVIFNALIIPLLIPLSLRGVRYRPIGATGAAAPQHPDLRPRRHHRPLHRDQADRPRRPQPAGGLRREMVRRSAGRRARSAASPAATNGALARVHRRPPGASGRGGIDGPLRRGGVACLRSAAPRSPEARRCCMPGRATGCGRPSRCRPRRCARLRSLAQPTRAGAALRPRLAHRSESPARATLEPRLASGDPRRVCDHQVPQRGPEPKLVRSCLAGRLQDLPRHGGGGRQDLPDAAGGPGRGRWRA